MNKVLYSTEFLELVSKETDNILEDIRSLYLLWNQLDSELKNVDSQEKNKLHASFYFFVKHISDTCKTNTKIFKFVLQELKIAKMDKNIDKIIVFEINKEAKRLSGSFNGITTKKDNLLNDIEVFRETLNYQVVTQNKNFISHILENGRKKGAEIAGHLLHVYSNIQSANEDYKQTKSDKKSNEPIYRGNEGVDMTTKTNFKLTNNVSKLPGDSEINESDKVVEKLSSTKLNTKPVEEVAQLKKQQMIDELAILIQVLSCKIINFNKFVDNAASYLATCVNEMEVNKEDLIGRLGKDGINVFGKIVETQAMKMTEITIVLQKSFKCITEEISKNIVPTHFINQPL